MVLTLDRASFSKCVSQPTSPLTGTLPLPNAYTGRKTLEICSQLFVRRR